jgi:hypothetical protein
MSSEAIGAVAPVASEATKVMDVGSEKLTETAKPTGLHSPPDSNNAVELDGSDSELSDLDDMVADQLQQEAEAEAKGLADTDIQDEVQVKVQPRVQVVEPSTPPEPEAQLSSEPDPTPAEDDIGEVLPDHYSGTVPVFKPTMDQFKDFKLFVCLSRYLAS